MLDGRRIVVVMPAYRAGRYADVIRDLEPLTLTLDRPDGNSLCAGLLLALAYHHRGDAARARALFAPIDRTLPPLWGDREAAHLIGLRPLYQEAKRALGEGLSPLR